MKANIHPSRMIAIAGAAAGLLLTTAQGANAAADQAAQPTLRLRIAVDQFKWNETRDAYRVPGEVSEGLQALLVEKLQKSGHFIVMEREATAAAQGERERDIDSQKRAGLSRNNPAAAARPRADRTPAQFIITPTVVGFSETKSGGGGISTQLGSFFNRKTETTLTINIRISDAETSRTIETQTAKGSARVKSGNNGISLMGIDWRSDSKKSDPLADVVQKTLDDAVSQICDRLAKEPWSAMVAAQDKSTGRVIINAGDDSGVTTGMVFNVYKTGGAIYDPVTGDVLTEGDETLIGRIRIVRSSRGVAFGEVVNGKTFQAGNIVRPA